MQTPNQQKGTMTDTGTRQANKILVPVAELAVGMYVCELDRPWLESPFWFQGFPLQSEQDIEEVQRVCRYVFVDAKRSTQSTRKRLARMEKAEATQVKQRTVKAGALGQGSVKRVVTGIRERLAQRRGLGETIRSVRVSQHAFDETARFVHEVIERTRARKSIDIRGGRETVAGCVDHITRHPAAMLLLGSIRSKDEYTAQHSLSVGLHAMVLGNQLRFSREDLTELGICGILHDVGKLRAPDEILKKPGRLTPEELQVMQQHPAQGRLILESAGGVFRQALEVTHGHHERLDGSGYPRGLTSERLDLYTRLVAIVDTYDAVTSERPYARARSHFEAIKILRSESGNRYDAELVTQLIDALGLLPVGSVVQLNNGCVAVLMRPNAERPFRPVVLVMKGGDGEDIEPYYLDLARQDPNASVQLSVARILNSDEAGIDISLFRDQEFLRRIRSG